MSPVEPSPLPSPGVNMSLRLTPKHEKLC